MIEKNAKRPADAAPYSGTPLSTVCIRDKYKRGVGFSSTERQDYTGICDCGANQIIDCYGETCYDGQYYNAYDFAYRCEGCPHCIAKTSGFPDPLRKNIYSAYFVYERFYEEMLPDSPKFFVYFISDGEFIKIGKAKDPNKRLLELQTGNARPLRILYLIPCKTEKIAYKIEKFLHFAYKDYSLVGEWFDILNKIYREEFETLFSAKED